jgi:hypothetical protein
MVNRSMSYPCSSLRSEKPYPSLTVTSNPTTLPLDFQLVLSSTFLCPLESVVLRSAKPGWPLGSPFGTYDTWPLAPTTVRRCRAFGERSISRSASHTLPSNELLGHLAWGNLYPASRYSVIQALPIMEPCATLLRYAGTHRYHIRTHLQAERSAPNSFIGLQPQRTRYMGATLLLFDCCYGDLVRWLGVEYTNQDRNWQALRAIYAPADQESTPTRYPITDFHLSYRAMTEGVPLRGHFQCSAADTRERIRYNSHPPTSQNQNDARKKFAAEEANSYHIGLPSFLAMCILGLFVSPISWVIKKGKGRIIIDPSTKLCHNDSGVPNSYIPPTGTPGMEEAANRDTRYGRRKSTCFLRHRHSQARGAHMESPHLPPTRGHSTTLRRY